MLFGEPSHTYLLSTFSRSYPNPNSSSTEVLKEDALLKNKWDREYVPYLKPKKVAREKTSKKRN
jgi:hypothetical protein